MEGLYRPRENRMIAGVAAGLARYLNLDISLVRLLWILAVFLGGSGVIIYIIAWIVIPEERFGDRFQSAEDAGAADSAAASESQPFSVSSEPRRHSNLGGLILIGLGVFFLIRQFLPFDIMQYFWPLLLVVLGVYLLISRR